MRSGYLQCSEASREGLTQRPHGFAVTGFFLAARASKLAPRQTKKPSTLRVGAFVPEIGVEPIHPCGRQILSLLRLPIPPPGQGRTKIRNQEGMSKQPNFKFRQIILPVPTIVVGISAGSSIPLSATSLPGKQHPADKLPKPA